MKWPVLAAALATLFGFGARILGLWELPPGFNMDEGFYGMDSLAALAGDIRPFYPANGGRESLFMLLAAPFVAVLGREPIAMRLPAAFGAILLVPMTFALGRQVLCGWLGQIPAAWVGASAAWLVAGSGFLVVLGRTGIRVNWFPVLLALALICFWRARTSRRALFWAVAGAAAGLLEYTYSAARVLPAIIPGVAILDAVAERRLRDLVRPQRAWLWFAATAGLVVAPLVLYALTHPEEFFRRQAALSPLNEEKSGQAFVPRVAGALWGGLSMFFVRGDEKLYRNIAGEPFFDLWIAPVFILGVFVLAADAWRHPAARLIGATLAVFYAAGAIPLGAVPHNVHWIGLAPAMFLLPGIGAAWTRQRFPKLGRAAVSAVAFGVIASAGLGVWEYATVWARDPDVARQYDGDMVDIANAMNDRRDEPGIGFAIVLSPFYPDAYTHGTIDYLYKGPAPYVYVPADEASAAPVLDSLRKRARTIVTFQRLPPRDLPADNREVVDWLLLQHGEKVDDEYHASYRVSEYEVRPSTSAAAQPVPVRANAGPVRLELIASGVAPSARFWVRLELSLAARTDANLKLSMRLVRPNGSVAAQDDRLLMRRDSFEGTSLWAAGESGVALFLLNAPPGQRVDAAWSLAVVAYEDGSGRPASDVLPIGPAIR